jgi:serine/threonine protein kinase/tetratricopeptide (TPR) repeat protein
VNDTTGELHIPLGPFQLIRPVGQGGMGMVWLARHREQGVMVAIKVITGASAGSPEYQRAFDREVQAAAQLDHPGIVWLFDYGRISGEAARASNHQLVEGSPYLAMEYASGGTLRSYGEGVPWPELRSLVLALLDALAHAHARGVLHRDIKPDNVLIARKGDLRPGYKLTDYGIAHPMADSGVSHAGEDRPVGTPHFMAPEQIRGDFHHYGPHTDLYALGCMVYRLVAGRLPYKGMKGPPLMYAQLTKPPPPLEPIHPVPEGFSDWLDGLIAKDPAARYQRAADAALALAELGEAPGGAPRAVALTPDDELPTLDIELETSTLRVLTASVDRAKRQAIDPRRRPRLPDSWRRVDVHSRPLRLMGAGLGLFGLRPTPFVGRAAERDHLWTELQQVHLEGRVRATVVRGQAGTGRSRLVHWIAERAHEVGGAQVMRATFSATSSAPEALRKMLVRFLRSWPQDEEQEQERFGELLERWGLSGQAPHVALDQLLDPDRTPLQDHQRHHVVRRVLQIVGSTRPLIVVLDDVQWSVDALKLVHFLLHQREKPPVAAWFVLTALDGVVEPYAEAARRLAQVPRIDGGSEVVVQPLGHEARTQLVEEMLGLEHALALRVAERTGGNPLFATQLIGDWVERGVLRSTPSGFTLDGDAALPASLQEVWQGRIEQLVDGLEDPAPLMLERAAVLGREVDIWEWQQVCDDPDGAHARIQHVFFRPKNARLRTVLMDRLFANRLVQATDVGFVFTHAQFREALEARARGRGRLVAHHDAAGNVLVHQLSPTNAERAGRHLVAAGRPAEAVRPLLMAVEHRAHTMGHVAALGLLDEVEEAMTVASLAPSDRAWGELAALRATTLEALDRHGEAWKEARKAWAVAGPGQWHDLRARSAVVQGAVALKAGRAEEAEQHYLRAVKLLGSSDEVPYVALQAWHQLRTLAHRRGDTTLARARGEEVRAVALRLTEGPPGAFGHAAVAGYALAEGDLTEARSFADRALQIALDAGDLLGQARAHSLLAEIAVRCDDVEAARSAFAAGVGCFDELGDSAAHYMRCQWASFEAKQGDFGRCQAAVEPALAQLPDERSLAAALHVCMLTATAGRARWPQFEQHLSACERLLPQVTNAALTYAEMAEMAGDLCIQRRQRVRALKCWALAVERWLAVDRPEAAQRVVQRMETLGAAPT